MQVRCEQLEYQTLTPSQLGRVTKGSLEGCLTLGTHYEVFGIGQWESKLNFLVRADDSKPTWAPAGLFVVTNDKMPDNWRFTLKDGIYRSGEDLWNKWVFMCGYIELIDDPTHSDKLMERESTALQIFAAQYVSTLPTDDCQGI